MVSRRNNETRDQNKRRQGWKPASLLPTPAHQDGVVFRWVRVGSRGNSDSQNVSKRFREGWVQVNSKDHPELKVMNDQDTRFAEGVEIGQLLLCKIDAETANARREHYEDMSRTQIDALDKNYMRENDARMPLMKPERRTRTSFGESE